MESAKKAAADWVLTLRFSIEVKLGQNRQKNGCSSSRKSIRFGKRSKSGDCMRTFFELIQTCFEWQKMSRNKKKWFRKNLPQRTHHEGRWFRVDIVRFAIQSNTRSENRSAPDRLTITSARLFPIEFHQSRRFFLVASWDFNARL